MQPLVKSIYRLLLSSLLIAFAPAWATGQHWPYRIDSLEAHVREGQPDSLLYHTLYALAQMKAKMNTDSAVNYAWQLIALADRMEELPRQIRSKRVLGEVYYHAGMTDSVEQATLRAIAQGDHCQTERCFFETMHAIKLLRLPLRQKGKIKEIIRWWDHFLATPDLPPSIAFEVRRLISYPLLEMGDHDRSLKELQQVWKYGREARDTVLLCNALGELSVTYFQMGQTEKSLEVAYERLAVCQALDRRPAVVHAYNQIGGILLRLERYDSSYTHYRQMLEMVTEEDYIYPYVLGGLLESAPAMDRAEVAQYVQRIKALLQFREATNDQDFHQRQYLYGIISRYYLAAGDYAQAQQYARKRLDWVRSLQSDTTELAVDALELLAQTQAAGGDHKGAWESYTQFHQLKMAMVNRNQEDALARTVVELNLTENELARQKAEQEIVLEKQASSVRTQFFLIILGVAGLLLAIVFWAYRRSQQDQQLIREKNQQIEQSLTEKEVLLKEIHHRVKNNLQIISSLLDKQARKSSDQAVQQLVREGKERIQSMALIHQNLYESEHLSGIDIKSYLQELSTNIQSSQAVSKGQVKLELNMIDEKLDIDTAIPVGLILNELLTNCYKYAFTQSQKGTIKVDFLKESGTYLLQVSDNGVGFPPEPRKNKKASLGLNLVKGLVRQLEGTMEWIKVEKGSTIAIRF